MTSVLIRLGPGNVQRETMKTLGENPFIGWREISEETNPQSGASRTGRNMFLSFPTECVLGSGSPRKPIQRTQGVVPALTLTNRGQFSCSVVSHSLWPHELQHARPSCHHQLPEFTQTHVHQVSDAIQPSLPLSSPSPPALNLSQHQGLFKWVSSLHQVAKVLEFQLQHQSFQWTPRTNLLVALGKCPQFPVKCRADKNGDPNKYQNKMSRPALNKLIDLERTL